MRDQNIVCFSKDWSEPPTSVNHVMRLLSRDNRVLWLNSIGTRVPNPTKGNDLRRILGRLAGLGRGPQPVARNLSVLSPLVLPLPHSPAVRRLNRFLMRVTIARATRRLGMEDYQLWSFLPTAVDYVGRLGESLVVYYVTDQWSQFAFLDEHRILAMEQQFCRKADVVFTTSRTLWEEKRSLNPETHLASHGVDHAFFARALEPATPIPPELTSLQGPIIGFFGFLQNWVDLGLLAYVAEKRPQWSVVLLGRSEVDLSMLARLPNVHVLGLRPYEELPGYCKGFSVGTCPFVMNELTRHVNPIKLREYLSAGLPVVSTPLPEVINYRDHCYLASSPEEFLTQCERAIQEDSPERRRARSDAMRGETWEAAVREIGEHVMRVRAAKVRARTPA